MQKVFLSQQSTIRMKFLRKFFVDDTGLFLSLLIGLCLFPAAISAQTGTSGQIAGTVIDQSGAVVPEATVTATLIATGEKRSITASSDGNFTIANLSVGIYRLSISKTGFKETVVSNVVVNVASSTRLDVTLQTGEISETVNITSDTVQVETQSGTVGEVVSGEQVRELPLNGRSFVQLTQLQPGVSAANNFDSKQKGLFGGVDFSVNGNSGQANLFLTDGANNNDTGSNRTILLFPSIEAIAEFRSLRNSYGPEHGQAAGAIITIVTRGGSNNFHGSLFYFGRNDALNATEFFANQSGSEKNALRRNDFGGSIGGPIIKDRAFFFYSQEWNKEIRGQTRFGSVPTLRERRGDFSQPRFAPNGQRCSPDPIQNPSHPGFATQIIPQASLSAGGLLLAKLFPEPNVANPTDCTNWSQSANSGINFREENVRIDANINSKNKIFGRYTQDSWSNGTPILTGNLWGDDPYPVVESSWSQPSKQAAIKLTTQLGSNAINEVQFSYSANRINVVSGAGSDLNRQINTAIPGFYPDAQKVNGLDRPHPRFWGIAPYYHNQGGNIWTQTPFKNSLDIYSVRDDFSLVSGNHTFKFGGLFDTAAKNEDAGPNEETVTFGQTGSGCCAPPGSNHSGNWGNGLLQDLLTDNTFHQFTETDVMPVGQNRYKNLEFYFGDTWKAKQNLTLELGVRYSLLFEPVDARDRISGFSPGAYNPARPATDPCNGLVVPKGTNPCAGIAGASTPIEFSNRSLRENSYGNLAPRLGVAWDVFSNGKTAIRGGFGQFFLRERTSPYFAALTVNSPFSRTVSYAQRLLNGSAYLDLPTAANGSPRFGLSPEAATPYSLQFNVSFGQQLWKDTVLEVGYVGNRARRQLTHSDVNQVSANNRIPAAFATSGNAVNAFRPFSNYGSIYLFEREGRADYNSLQVLFRTRFLEKSSLQFAYTYSKSKADFGLNDSSGSNSLFAVLDRTARGLDFAESDINRPHIFVANLIYNFPSFKSFNPVVRTLLGGWEFASIIQVTSGTSLTPNLNGTGISGVPAPGGQPPTFFGGISGLGTGVQNQRPIRVENVPCRLENGEKNVFFNPAAWTLVGYKIGQTVPAKSTCEGPPTKNVDMSIYKNFAPSWLTNSFFGEAARLQFRFEFFNAFNTPQFGGGLPTIFFDGQVECGTAVCSPTNNTITKFNPTNPGRPNGNFGVAGNTRGAREIQYAFKFYF